VLGDLKRKFGMAILLITHNLASSVTWRIASP